MATRSEGEAEGWLRLDTWLWQARVLKSRADCGALTEAGGVRINRQPTDKPHARVRIGDVLTIAPPGGHAVRVLTVRALGDRRGPAIEARTLYEEM